MPKKSMKPRRRMQKINAPKNCYFEEEKKEPSFSDTATLQRFITDRGKIIPRSRSGVCSKHQKDLTTEVKHARFLALLPFVVRS